MSKEAATTIVMEAEHEQWAIKVEKVKVKSEIKRTIKIRFDNLRYDEAYEISDELEEHTVERLREIVEKSPNEDQRNLFDKT